MQERLEQILEECRKYTWQGEVASYIPELAKANREELGIYVATDHGEFFAGDWDKTFTIQSIVKTIFLMLAAQDNGIQYVKEHVGVEATGKPFNAIDYAEHKLLREHINPMVNIGAIAVCELVKASSNDERLERLLAYGNYYAIMRPMQALEGLEPDILRGDMNDDGEVTDADALYLLRNTLFPDRYPITQSGDVNGDGEVTDGDALYLLRYTLFPDRYPLN